MPLALQDVERRATPLRRDAEYVVLRRAPEPDSDAVLLVTTASEHPPPLSIERLKHEYALRDWLDPAWAAKPLALVQDHGRGQLVLLDPGGQLLSGLVGRGWDLGVFLRVAIGVSVALGHAHAQGLIHKDVKPDHVLVDVATGAAWLTGFGIASRLPRERQTPDSPETIAGTLAYMAPEQTGRMNRSVDTRSDLYALGVVLYQMLTGELPFTGGDPMELVHCHIARQPVRPVDRAPGLPAPISAIVMKLLAKTAEERYQTAAGVTADLQRYAFRWEAGDELEAFEPLGQHDRPDRILIPEKLYGRAREVATLLETFDRVVRGGSPELVLVSGYSGIGKSSVVNELQKALVPPRGLYASGKFDQYKRDIPYSTLAQAFQALTRRLLAKSDAELVPWRDALGEALGPNGRLITELVPELSLIIGEQPAVPELPPQDARGRFQLVFRRFIGVFARPDHPLALFLDDLQWLDAATLDLLENLLAPRSDLRHLLLIGAYRDNEVTSAHPLMRTLGAIRSAGARVHEVVLAPLVREDVQHLVADSLYCERDSATPLAELVLEKTAGNPFFVIQFLSALAEEGLLTFDHRAARWSWDLARIHAKGYTDNVVDLMIGKLSRLPVRTQEVLQQLACLGNSAESSLLAMVCENSEETLRADLHEALATGLVLHADGAYRFLHDRVQEAAYSLIPAARRAETHLRIGRLLVAHTAPAKQQDTIFEIVNQLNRGAALITARAEKEQLAEFNLAAGRRAKASTAYVSALRYLLAGAALLSEDRWEQRPDLVFALELQQAECQFLTGDFASAEDRLTMLAARAATSIDRATVACLRIDLYMTRDRNDRGVGVSLDYLRHLGIDWSPHPTEEESRREYERTWSLLGRRDLATLTELPLMREPAVVATMDVLTRALTPALYTDTNLLCLLICRMIDLTLEHGNTDGSCLAYVWLGRIAGSRFGNYQAGFRFGRLGCDLVEQSALERYKARVYIAFANFCMPWIQHVRSGQDLLRRAYDSANSHGDLTHAAFSCNNLITNLLAAGDPLADVQLEAERGLAFARKSGFNAVIDIISAQLALIRTLRGLTPRFGCLNDEPFDESRFELGLSNGPELAGAPIAAFRYWTRKLQARFLAGDYGAANDAALNAQRLFWTLPSVPDSAEAHFYGALSRAAACADASPEQRRQHAEALTAHHQQLVRWAENCPENFQNRAALVGAEIARIEGREMDAARLYEEAIRSARENGFLHNEAIACEVAAHFYAARGFDEIGQLYLRKARGRYLRWGADGKVRQLDETYPDILDEERSLPATGTTAAPLEQIDLATVFKVSQALSGEIVLERMFDTIMRIAIEHAGAQRGLLIIARAGEQRIAAEVTTAGGAVVVQMQDHAVTAGSLPQSVFHYVLHTLESVILDDAAAHGAFTGDAYIRERRARSILCLPLLKQAKLIGVLYLENGLAARAFTPARITVLDLVASQAAIALENTRLYVDLQKAHRLEAMGTLAGGIAHDFNNILGAILGYGEMALRDIGTAARLRRDLEAIMTAGERGRALVDRVLAFSRSSVGERVAVHVEAVVREALDLLSAKLPETIELGATLTAGNAALLGDPTQVHQVVMNLGTNAAQAMPDGGVLSVSLGVQRVDAPRIASTGTLDPGEYLVLRVTDTGTGMTAQVIERIFEPFFTTKEAGSGTGLGLSLVHGIVTQVGGAVDVASTLGKGSTFTVYLPRSGDALDDAGDAGLALPCGDGQRVLVVDDEEPLVNLATRILADLGYLPEGFTSSQAALAAFRAEPQRFDAVISDERMPGMSGSTLIREVRSIRAAIPVVLISGYVGGGLAGRARDAGADEVLKKPLLARDLAASLARVLQPGRDGQGVG